jgi:hypothetical protein
VAGQLFFWILGWPVTSSKIDERNVHLLCNSYSLSTSASDAEKRVVDHAVARSVSAIHQLSSDTPCSCATVYTCDELDGLERKPG